MTEIGICLRLDGCGIPTSPSTSSVATRLSPSHRRPAKTVTGAPSTIVTSESSTPSPERTPPTPPQMTPASPVKTHSTTSSTTSFTGVKTSISDSKNPLNLSLSPDPSPPSVPPIIPVLSSHSTSGSTSPTPTDLDIITSTSTITVYPTASAPAGAAHANRALPVAGIVIGLFALACILSALLIARRRRLRAQRSAQIAEQLGRVQRSFSSTRFAGSAGDDSSFDGSLIDVE